MKQDKNATRPSGVSRRTVVKGAAWAVPAITVASAVPAYAASAPPPPVFDFANAWKNPGNKCTSACIPKQSYGVKVTVSNPSAQDYIIQFTSYAIDGDSIGVFGVTGTMGCQAVSGTCAATCAAYAVNSVCIPAGTASKDLYVNSNNYGSSPQGGQAIGWRWVDASTCTVLASDTAISLTSPPNDAC